MQVGIYYASNAMGRLFGTLLSGFLYTYVGNTIVDGFGACVLCSCAVSLVSAGVDYFLKEDQKGATYFGAFNRCFPCWSQPEIYTEGDIEEQSVQGGLGGSEFQGSVEESPVPLEITDTPLMNPKNDTMSHMNTTSTE